VSMGLFPNDRWVFGPFSVGDGVFVAEQKSDCGT